jgi:hypothetical protein
MRSANWCGSNCLARMALALIVGCGCFGVSQRVAVAAGSDVTEALQLVPNEALGAIVVSNLSALDGKLTKAAAAMGAHVGSHLDMVKGMLGIQEGLDERRAAIAVVLPSVAEGSPLPFATLAVPVTDYDKFIGNFPTAGLEDGFSRVAMVHGGDDTGAAHTLWAIKKDKYALLMFPYALAGESDEAQVEMRKKLKKLLVDRKAEMSPEMAKTKDWLAKQDVGTVMTTAGVQQAMGAAKGGLQQLKAALELNANLRDVAGNLAVYETAFSWIEKEVSQLLVGLRIDDDSTVRLASRANLAGSGEWKAFASSLAPLGDKPLSGLPGGPFAGAFEGSFSGSRLGFLSDVSLQMMKASAAQSGESQLTDHDWKRLGESMAKSMEGLRSMSVVVGVPKEGETLYAAMGAFAKVADSAKYLDNYAESINALNEVSEKSKSPMLGKYETKKIELEGLPTLEVTVDFTDMLASVEQQVGRSDAMKAYMEFLVGKTGKMTGYVQAVDKTTVVLAWSDKASLIRTKAALSSPAEGLAGDAGVKSTLALMPKGCQWMVLVSPPGLASVVKSVVQAFGLPGDRLPDFGAMPPLGVSVKLEKDSLEKELVLPGKTLEAIGKTLHGGS